MCVCTLSQYGEGPKFTAPIDACGVTVVVASCGSKVMVWEWLKSGFEVRYIGEERKLRLEMEVDRDRDGSQ